MIKDTLRFDPVDCAEKQTDERQGLSRDRLQGANPPFVYLPNVSLPDVKRIRLPAYRGHSFSNNSPVFRPFHMGQDCIEVYSFLASLIRALRNHSLSL